MLKAYLGQGVPPLVAAVYIPCIYTHASESYRRRLSFVVLTSVRYFERWLTPLSVCWLHHVRNSFKFRVFHFDVTKVSLASRIERKLGSSQFMPRARVCVSCHSLWSEWRPQPFHSDDTNQYCSDVWSITVGFLAPIYFQLIMIGNILVKLAARVDEEI